MGVAGTVGYDQASGWQVPQQHFSSAAASRLTGCQDKGERAPPGPHSEPGFWWCGRPG
jgi:hypothetical protein